MINAQQFIRMSKVSCYWADGGKRVSGSGARPDDRLPSWVEERYYPASLNVRNNGLAFSAVGPKDDYETLYIPYAPGKAIISAPIARGHLLSGGFAGCTFQLYHNGMGRVIGAHVYQGANDHRNFEYEAALAGWELLYSWESNGLINDPTMRKSGFVFVAVTPDLVEVVAVKLTGQGKAEEVLALCKLEDWKNYNGGSYGVTTVEVKPRTQMNRTRAHSL